MWTNNFIFCWKFHKLKFFNIIHYNFLLIQMNLNYFAKDHAKEYLQNHYWWSKLQLLNYHYLSQPLRGSIQRSSVIDNHPRLKRYNCISSFWMKFFTICSFHNAKQHWWCPFSGTQLLIVVSQNECMQMLDIQL